MKTINFRLNRRRQFTAIVVTIVIELCVFAFWIYNYLDSEMISPNEKYGSAISIFVCVSIVNGIGLWILDRLLFNKDAMLQRIYTKRSHLRAKQDSLQKTLIAITNKDGKAIHTPAAIEVWRTVPMYCFQKFDQIILSMQKKLNEIDNELILLDKKESFWIKVGRKNLWMYFMSQLEMY